MRNLLVIGVGVAFLFVISATPLFAQCGSGQDKCPMKKLKKGLWCKKCDEILDKEKDLDKDGNHKKCAQKPEKVKICIRKGYRCEECDEVSSRKRRCPSCGKKMKKYYDVARVLYRCPECFEEFDKKGKCPDCKRRLRKTCAKAGEEPHVSPRRRVCCPGR